MQTDSNGNVFIPLADPATGMHIGGSSATSKTLTIFNTKSLGATQVDIQAGSSQGANPLLRWLNNAGTALGVIDASGNVGIGTTTPAANLDVAGQISLEGNKIISVADPTNPLDAANKEYVDAASGGNKTISPSTWTFGGAFNSTIAGVCTNCSTGLSVPLTASQVVIFELYSSVENTFAENQISMDIRTWNGTTRCDIVSSTWSTTESGCALLTALVGKSTSFMTMAPGPDSPVSCAAYIRASDGAINYTDTFATTDCAFGFYYR